MKTGQRTRTEILKDIIMCLENEARRLFCVWRKTWHVTSSAKQEVLGSRPHLSQLSHCEGGPDIKSESL